MERAKLHHLTHGAPSGKQKNDQVTLWSLQPQLASVVDLISGVPWLSSSAPLKPLTNFPYSGPSQPPSSRQPLGAVAMAEAKAPTIPYPGKGQESESKGLLLPAPTSCLAHYKGCPSSLTLPPPHLFSPQLGQGMESIISLCWLPEPQNVDFPGPRSQGPTLRVGA